MPRFISAKYAIQSNSSLCTFATTVLKIGFGVQSTTYIFHTNLFSELSNARSIKLFVIVLCLLSHRFVNLLSTGRFRNRDYNLVRSNDATITAQLNLHIHISFLCLGLQSQAASIEPQQPDLAPVWAQAHESRISDHQMQANFQPFTNNHQIPIGQPNVNRPATAMPSQNQDQYGEHIRSSNHQLQQFYRGNRVCSMKVKIVFIKYRRI